MTTQTPAALEVATRALNKAKIQLMSKPDTTFFTTVCFSLKHLWDFTVPTACTDGREIRYNPDFFMKQGPDEQLGLLLHETYHVVLGHMTRLAGRCPFKWNMAADYAINQMITDRGFKIPKGGLLDEKYRGMTAEQIYDLLPDPPKDESTIHFEMPTDGPAENGIATPVPVEVVEREIQDILVRAKIQSEIAGDAPGSIPGEIELFISNLLKPKIPFAQLLRRYFNGFAKTDYAWTHPNRRYFPDHILPSLYGESMGHVAFAADASGSVSDADFQRIISEVGGVIKKVKPDLISLVTFDTHIRQVDELSTLTELKNIKFTGRGGTRIGPTIQWALENKPKVMVVFTDGYFTFPEDLPSVKVPFLWIIHDNPGFKAPFGRVIHYEV